MVMRIFYKKLLIVLILLGIGLFYYFGGSDFINFTYLKSNLFEINALYQQRPFLVLSVFSGAFLFLAIFAIPGSIVLTVLSGAIFGAFNGVIIVSVCGTIGATCSFIIARFLLRNYLSKKFHRQFLSINRGLNEDGILYLFILRLIPASPFVIINLVMGLTTLNIWTFIWTSFLGMIPGNVIYIFAGHEISEFDSPAEVMTPSLLILLTLLGVLPVFGRKILRYRKKK